jgi:hypothetical protein
MLLDREWVKYGAGSPAIFGCTWPELFFEGHEAKYAAEAARSEVPVASRSNPILGSHRGPPFLRSKKFLAAHRCIVRERRPSAEATRRC